MVQAPSAPTTPSSAAPASEQRLPALTARALVFGLASVVVTCLVVCFAELVVGKIQIGFLQLPPVAVGMLVMLLAVRAAYGRLARSVHRAGRELLRPHELFTVYVMVVLASMVSSRGLLEKLVPLLAVPNYNANTANNWSGLFFRFIPRWAVPWDPSGKVQQFSVARFFDGLQPGEHVPWQAWVVPLAAWGIFVALMLTAFLCMAVILRRQWVDNEKLSFPLTQLPLEMVRSDSSAARDAAGGSFLANRITWFGFGLAVCVFGFNGLHQWYPNIPEFRTDLDMRQYLVDPSWSNVGFFHAYVSLAAIGFFYLLPTDLLFSLWFFYLLTIGADVFSYQMGYQPETMPMYGCKTYIGYQIIGCYAVMVAFMLWAARPHLARVWRAACTWGKGAPTYGADEALSYRTALFGLAASVALCVLWLTALGMAWWLALFELCVLLFMVVLVMARSTCESGMLMTETTFRPIDVYRMVGDVRQLGGANMTSLAFLDALWMRDQRGLVLTGFLDSMKLADGVRVRRRSLLGVFALALLVALAVSGFLHINLPYRYGAVQMYSYVYQGNPVWAFNDAATVLNGSRPPLPWFAQFNFIIGGVVTFAIVMLRSRLAWFPIHPLGYALCGSWTMMVFWFPCLVAWLCKVVILRYGGMKLYARARPFFLGMVLGEFTTAILFTLPALYDRLTPTPAFPWP